MTSEYIPNDDFDFFWLQESTKRFLLIKGRCLFIPLKNHIYRNRDMQQSTVEQIVSLNRSTILIYSSIKNQINCCDKHVPVVKH